MRILQQIGRTLRKTEGAEIAEAAMVLPLVFMLLLGIVWFGRAFNIYSTIQQAAQQGATVAARSTCATCGNTAALDTAVDNAITGVLQSSSLDPNQIQLPIDPGLLACPAPPGGGCVPKAHNVYVCRNVVLNSSASPVQPTQCGTVVTFQYPFSFNFPFTSLNMQPVVMSAQAQSRMEN